MKKIIILLIASVMMLPLTAQQGDTIPEITSAPEVEEAPVVEEVIIVEESTDGSVYSDTVNVMNRVEVIETPESTRVTLGQNEVFIVEENGDTVRVVLGSRGVSIVEGPNGTEVKVLDMDDYPQKTYRHKKKRFRPHYAGIEFGLNNYLNSDFSLTLPPEDRYMDLNTGKSWNFNINFVDIGFALGTEYVGIASGLGFEFIDYHFNGQNGIMKDEITSEIVEYVPDYYQNITKSKFTMTYLTAPLLLEFQIPTARRKIFINVGVVGGLKLCSRTKIISKAGGARAKEKVKSDYNLNPFRYGFTARVGYSFFGFQATYYMTPLFKDGMGPELYPFNAGIAFYW